MVIFFNLLSFFFYFSCACLEAMESEELDQRQRRGLASRRNSSLSVIVPSLDPKREEAVQREAFNSEIIKLREILSTGDPKKHFVVFDCHGTLTNKKTPDVSERPYEEVVKIYQEFSAREATVIISSAWEDMGRVLQSLDAAGIKHASEIQTEIMEGYEIMYVGNVVSAREVERFLDADKFYSKREAALWYARKQGIDEISSLTLLDDQDSNLQIFTRESRSVFSVSCPLPKGILVP